MKVFLGNIKRMRWERFSVMGGAILFVSGLLTLTFSISEGGWIYSISFVVLGFWGMAFEYLRVIKENQS